MDKVEKQNIQQDSYKTGATAPPKKRGGLIAGLLVVVILLAGISSILGVMNVRLFRMLEEEKNESVAFVPNATEYAQPGQEQEADGKPKLGLTVADINELDRRFYRLPAGVLVTKVNPKGRAAAAGIAAGDIITRFDGIRIATMQELEQVLQECQSDTVVEVIFYRPRTGRDYRTTIVMADNR